MKKRVLTLLLALMICFSLCTPAWAALPSKGEAATDELYVETASAYGVNALDIIEDAGVKQKIRNQMDEMQLELVQVSTKSVYVEEGYNETGEFMSRILTKAEVNQLQGTDIPLGSAAEDSVNKSTGSQSKGKLTISLTYLRDAHYNYVLTGEASWSSGSGSGTGATSPYMGEDFMSIQWGGDNEYLKTNSYAFMGIYNDKSRITGHETISNPYGCYCWSFDEKLDSKTMDSATALVTLRTTYPESQNRETGAMFTYIHTYEKLSASVSINYDENKFSGGVTLSGCSKQWQIAVSVDTIKF